MLLSPTVAAATTPAADALNNYRRWPAKPAQHVEKGPIVYALELVSGKYYIGYTANGDESLETRLKAHFSGTGAAWTRKYTPVRVLEKITTTTTSGGVVDEFLENAVTKRYMKRYGVENVRGGSYCLETLDAATVAFLRRELVSACYECGAESHFRNQCPVLLQKRAEQQLRTIEPLLCKRCCRNNHTEARCWAARDVAGNLLPPNTVRTFLKTSAERFDPHPAEKPAEDCGLLYSFYSWVNQHIFRRSAT